VLFPKSPKLLIVGSFAQTFRAPLDVVNRGKYGCETGWATGFRTFVGTFVVAFIEKEADPTKVSTKGGDKTQPLAKSFAAFF
jgi:hypothetical protein